MNRKIKFRMWIPDKSPGGTMVFRGIYDKNWYLHPSECKLYREIRQRDHQFPLMQFTGLQDISEKDIYEGDIVLYQENVGSNGEEIDSDIGVIEWFEDAASFVINWPESGLQGINECDITIVGNIYENPEILK